MNFGSLLSDFGKELSMAAAIVTQNEQARANGQSVLSIVEADAGVVISLLPAPEAAIGTIALDVTNETLALINAIRGAHASISAKAAATAPATADTGAEPAGDIPIAPAGAAPVAPAATAQAGVVLKGAKGA